MAYLVNKNTILDDKYYIAVVFQGAQNFAYH